MNNELIYQSIDNPNSVYTINLGDLQFVSFVEEQANFDPSFYIITREKRSRKMVLVRVEAD